MLLDIMKTIFKILGILLLGFFLFAAYIIWLNVHSDEDPEALLASMPDEIHPQYSQENSTNWWKSTAVYQIYPRSFKDSDGDGIGDIPGIISQLDYIQSLGFETIWFSPFFKSPQADHGYDVSDYREIQPAYGDMALVDSLITEIHERDMKIVLDLVLNHTSIEHAWFQESRNLNFLLRIFMRKPLNMRLFTPTLWCLPMYLVITTNSEVLPG